MALIVIDTSVLIGFLDASDELHERSRAALQDPSTIDQEWTVPTTVCAELLVGAYRAGRRAAETVESFIEEGIDRIEPVTMPIAKRAAQLRADHGRLGLADAFVIATGEILDADAVLTSDSAWQRVSRLVRVV